MSRPRFLLREVDEAVRQDRYQQLWDRYGLYAAGPRRARGRRGVAGYKGWTYWQEKQAQDAGAQFTHALSMEDGADAAQGPRDADRAWRRTGRKAIACWRASSSPPAEAKAGETDKAVADYDALATDPRIDPILQGNATLQAAALRLDKADYAEMERRLKGLVDSGQRLAIFRARAARTVRLPAEQHARGREAIQRAGRRSGNARRICGSAPT